MVRRYTQSEGGTGLGPAVRYTQRVGQALVRQYTQTGGGPGLGPAVHTVREWDRPWSGSIHSQRVGQAVPVPDSPGGGNCGLCSLFRG